MYPLFLASAAVLYYGIPVDRAEVIAESMASTTVPTKKTSNAEAKSDQMLPQILMLTSYRLISVVISTPAIAGTVLPSGKT